MAGSHQLLLSDCILYLKRDLTVFFFFYFSWFKCTNMFVSGEAEETIGVHFYE